MNKNKFKKEMKIERYNRQCRNTKNHKRLSWATKCKIDNLEKMDRFLEKFNLPWLNQEEIEIVNKPYISNGIKIVIKNLPKYKSPWPDGFTAEFYRRAKAYSSETLSKNCRWRNIFQLILQGRCHPDTKTKDITQKGKLQANISDEHIYNNPQQNSSQQNPTAH